MRAYIGVKQIHAEPQAKDGKAGYRVRYSDGYESWSPAEAFEKAYLSQGEDATRINSAMVEDFIAKVEVSKMGPKTTVVQATLKNGFIITESSSCVDPANYNEEVGEEICRERIENKVWELLGFALQWAVGGVK